jgi:hypothetical protein
MPRPKQIDFNESHVRAAFFISLHNHAAGHGSGLQRYDAIQTAFTNNHAA